MTDIKPWFLSKTIWGALVAIGASLASLAGMPVDAADQAALVEAALHAAGAGGALLAVIGRIGATTRIF